MRSGKLQLRAFFRLAIVVTTIAIGSAFPQEVGHASDSTGTPYLFSSEIIQWTGGSFLSSK